MRHKFCNAAVDHAQILEGPAPPGPPFHRRDVALALVTGRDGYEVGGRTRQNRVPRKRNANWESVDGRGLGTVVRAAMLDRPTPPHRLQGVGEVDHDRSVVGGRCVSTRPGLVPYRLHQ
jgi:hypothetical protein